MMQHDAHVQAWHDMRFAALMALMDELTDGSLT